MNNFAQAETRALETAAAGNAAIVEAAGTASTIPERANRTTYVPITSSVWDQQDKIDYHPVTSSFDAQDKVDYHPVP